MAKENFVRQPSTRKISEIKTVIRPKTLVIKPEALNKGGNFYFCGGNKPEQYKNPTPSNLDFCEFEKEIQLLEQMLVEEEQLQKNKSNDLVK